MSKKSERKRKDRERRVAQKKIAAQEKRVHEKAAGDAEKPPLKPRRTFTADPLPRRDQVVTSRKSPFTHRRTGG